MEQTEGKEKHREAVAIQWCSQENPHWKILSEDLEVKKSIPGKKEQVQRPWARSLLVYTRNSEASEWLEWRWAKGATAVGPVG